MKLLKIFNLAGLTNRYIWLFLLFLLSALPLHAKEDNVRTGLHFYSFEVDKDKRTGLNLTPEKHFYLPQGFTLSFELRLRVEVQSFGYVFRMIGNHSLAVDLIAYQFSPDGVFRLVLKNKALIQYFQEEIGGDINKDWIKFSMTFNPSSNRISLSVNGIEKTIDYDIHDFDHFNLYFGKNEHVDFYTTDVAPMTIRNIQLYNHEQQLIRDWELGKHGNNSVYDECKGQEAIAANPLWEIDKHVKWEKRTTFHLAGQHYQFAFDSVHDRIFIVRDRQVIIYHALTGQTDTLIVSKGYPYNVEPNQLLYDSNRDELVSYDYDEAQSARFNFHTREWSNENQEHIGTRFWHHGRYYSPKDSSIVIFGGYGLHKYSNLLQKYDTQQQQWERFNLSGPIHPRYLGSMGVLNDSSFLYFGGFGNESGNQEEGTENYYELYEVNLSTLSAQKRWTLPAVSEHFTNGNSLIVDRERNVFYSLAYPNNKYTSSILLNEYSLDEPEYRVLGDSLPYLFNDIDSYCDLFQSSDKETLFALVSTVQDNRSEVNIYSIAYPPLSPEQVIQTQKAKTSRLYIYLLSCGLLLLLGISIVLWKKKFVRKKESDFSSENRFIEDLAEVVPAPLLPSSIYLLGKFKVTDKAGNEMKDHFSPTTQQFFVLVLLSTLKNGNGITSDELNQQLWADKDDVNARNSRNVYINKIRTILKNMEGIEIVKQNGHWKINLQKNVFCDYMRILSLIHALKNKDDLNKHFLNELVDIALQGTLLPYMEAEWLDSFKAGFSNLIIETITRISKKKEWKIDLDLLLKMADVVLLHDNTEEYGIKLKCSVLLRLNRNVQARQVFHKFANDYEKLLSIKPNFTFEDIIKSYSGKQLMQ
jgi:DNA-binding SARP family transcriptional activator